MIHPGCSVLIRWGFIVALSVAVAPLAEAQTTRAAVPRPGSLGILAIVGGTASSVANPPDAGYADPFPLRRIVLPSGGGWDTQLDARIGPLRKLPWHEFERHVRDAAEEQQQTPARLSSAVYQATWEDHHLRGTLEWTIAHDSSRGMALALEPLQLALRDPKWTSGARAWLSTDQLRGRAAKSTFLWVPPGRVETMTSEWSCRGIEGPGEDQFVFSVPGSPIARLSLTLPADRVPSTTTPNVLLSGPEPASDPRLRRWQFNFAGLTQFTISIRQTSEQPAEVVRAKLAARHRLEPSEVETQFVLTLDSRRAPLGDRVIEVDPGLTVLEVRGDLTGPARIEAAPKPGAPSRVRVTCAERREGAQVVLRTWQPRPRTALWTCPGVRMLGALPGPEQHELEWNPLLKLDGWLTGDFRAVDSRSIEGEFATLKFVSTPLGNEGPTQRKMPQLRFLDAEPILATDEQLTWILEPGMNRVNAILKIRVLRGPVSSLTLRTNPGTTLDAVEAIPDDAGILILSQNPTLGQYVIEPSRAWSSGQTYELRLTFRGTAIPDIRDPAAARNIQTLPLPRCWLMQAVERQGTLLIQPRLVLWSIPGLSTTASARPQTFPYRGMEPPGSIQIVPEPIGVEASIQSRIRVAGKSAQVLSEFTLQPSRMIDSVTLYLPHGGAIRCSEPTHQLVRYPRPLIRLTTGGAILPALSTPLLEQHFAGEFVQIRFPSPQRGIVRFSIDSEASLQGPDDTPRILLPRIGGIRSPAHVTTLDPISNPSYAIQSTTDEAIILQPRLAGPSRVAQEQAATSVSMIGWRVDQQIDGSFRHTFQGVVRGLPGALVPVALPSSATLLGLRINGKQVELPLSTLPNRFAIPALLEQTDFEFSYHLPVTRQGPYLEARFEAAEIADLPESLSPQQVNLSEGVWLRVPASLLMQDVDPLVFRLVRTDVVRSLGLMLGILVVIPFVLLPARFRQFRNILLGGILVTAGVLSSLAPSGWELLIQPIIFVSGMVLIGMILRGPAIRLTVIGVSFIAASGGVAQAPEAATVWILPGPTASLFDSMVVVPVEVMKRLDALSQPGLPATLLTRAHYTVNLAEDGPRFEARYQIDATAPGELVFPLAGVRLASATLNGKEAFLDGTRPDRYVLTLPNAGSFELILRFQAMVRGTGADRECRVSIPDLPTTCVSVTKSPRILQWELPFRRGAIRYEPQTQIYEIDHGGGSELLFRWREPGSERTNPNVVVRGASLWDLGESEYKLTSAFLVRVEGGTLSRLKFDVPEGLMPFQVVVRVEDPRGDRLGIRAWTVRDEGKTRVLEVELQSRFSGRLQAVIQSYATGLPSLKPRLPLVQSLDGADPDSYYALRYQSLASESVSFSAMIDFPRESLIKEFGSIPELALESQPPERVMRRIAPTTPEIRPVLSPATNLTSATSETQYVLSSKVFATGLLRATGSNLSVLEWELPATVKVHEVRSPGLAGWSRQGSRLQLWWSQPRSDHTIRWQGMHSIDLPMGDAIARVPIPLSLPTVRWTTPPHLGIDSQIVRLKAEPAWLVDPLPSGPRVKPRPESTLDLPCFSIEGNLNTSVRFQIVRYFPPAEAARTETPRPQPSNPVVAPPKAENLPATVPLVPEPTEELGRDRITKISLWLIAVAISALVSHRLNPGWKPELIVLWCALLIPLLSPASPAMLVFLVILAGAVLVRLVRIVRYLVVVGFPHFAR